MIQAIAGTGIGLLVGLLARPFLDAFLASRYMRDAMREDTAAGVADVVTTQ